MLAFVAALEAYTLCRQKDTRCGDKLFAEAKKLDSAIVGDLSCSRLELPGAKKYDAAKADFKMALQLSKKSPQPRVHEAIALLLAACPVDRMRDGEKAVDHATQACELTKQRDWICIDTLSTAYAEAGDFDSAVKSANKALACAPADSQQPIRQRIALYQAKKPYRLK